MNRKWSITDLRMPNRRQASIAHANPAGTAPAPVDVSGHRYYQVLGSPRNPSYVVKVLIGNKCEEGTLLLS